MSQVVLSQRQCVQQRAAAVILEYVTWIGAFKQHTEVPGSAQQP